LGTSVLISGIWYNITVHGGRAAWQLPLGLTDPIGNWTIRMVDVLAGRTMQQTLSVRGAAAVRPGRQ